jgi:hypothetical protein
MDWLFLEWLILILVTPVVIVAVVILYGFVGCGSFESAGSAKPTPTPPMKPHHPTEFSATAVGPKRIIVSWKHSAGGGVKFKLVRREEGAVLTEPFPDETSPFSDDKNLKEGTTYRYTLTAYVPGHESNPIPDCLVTTLPFAPENIELIPEELDRIDVKWVNKSNKANDVLIEFISRVLDAMGQEINKTTGTQTFPKGVAQPVPRPVLAGSTNELLVFAVMEGWKDGKDKQQIKSDSKPVTRKSLAFKAEPTAFTIDQAPTLAGHTCVQRIAGGPGGLLANSGKLLRLWVRNDSATGALAFDKIYISQPNPDPNANEWDSDPANQKKVTDQQQSLPANSAKDVTPVEEYTLDQNKDLLIAFDINDNAGDCRYNDNLAGAIFYHKAATKQAKDADRSPNALDPTGTYQKFENRHYFIEKIEVS